MKTESFLLKGDLCYSKDSTHLETVANGVLVCLEGRCAGVFPRVPEQYQGLPRYDFSGRLVVPGLVDLHVHAPQYAYRGLGMDMELLDWLNTNAFPEEAKFADLDYAQRAYSLFVEDLRRGATTRAAVFATLHGPATRVLMELLEASGLCAFVGKVNMDRNSPDILREESAEASARATVEWLEQTAGKYRRVKPILTPRFIPSCSDELMERLAGIQRTFGLPVQSHLSENQGEVEWVRELCPSASCYGDAYASFGLFGGGVPTIMAHCVLSGEEEIAMLRERGVWVAHCPASNTNIASGIAPVRRFLDEGLRVGLGSDVAGGHSTSLFRAMADAIQVSKLRWRLQDQSLRPLTVEEAFWLGTAGGGAFFGPVGSFLPGCELDAVVVDDRRLATTRALTVRERLERVVYLSEDRDVAAKFVQGRQVLPDEKQVYISSQM